MFITRSRHERELDALIRTCTERVAEISRLNDRANAAADAALADLSRAWADAEAWQELARDAMRRSFDLHRRYAPPEPITEDITQPASLDEADRAAAERQRAKDQETA